MALATRRLLGNFLLLLLSSALALLALELAFRILRARAGGGKEQLERARYTEYDPLLGWHKVPGARVTYHRREYDVEVVINDDGLRDPPRSPEPAPGTLRILAAGDSFLEGYTVALEQTVTQQLERQLGEQGCRAEVINGGTTAYSTDQELLFYRSQGARYHPSIVTLFFFYNDILYNDRQFYFGLNKPIFQMTDEGLTLHRYPVRRPPTPTPAPEPAGPEQSSPEGSALLEWIGERLWTSAPRLYDALASARLWEPMRRVAPRTELRVYGVRRIEVLEEAWLKTEAILRTFRDEVTASGARFLVVYVPSRMEVQDDSWNLTQALYRDVQFERDAVARRLRGLGERNDFAVLDLTQAVRAADRGLLGRPYFRFDGHWTARGHAAAAGALHTFLNERGWLDGCAPNGGAKL
jgi:hypothetical protein